MPAPAVIDVLVQTTRVHGHAMPSVLRVRVFLNDDKVAAVKKVSDGAGIEIFSHAL